MRRAARIDDNHTEVVAALRHFGATVQSLAAVGKGVPDLLVSFHGRTLLLEVKDGKKPPSERRLTPGEERWIQAWDGEVHVVNSAEEALAVLGIRREIARGVK